MTILKASLGVRQWALVGANASRSSSAYAKLNVS